MLLEIRVSWWHKIALENQQRFKRNSLAWIWLFKHWGCDKRSARILLRSRFALAASRENWGVRNLWLLDFNPHRDFFCGALGQAALSLITLPGTLDTPWYSSRLSPHLGQLSKPTLREGAEASNTFHHHLHPEQCLHYTRTVVSLPTSLLSHLFLSTWEGLNGSISQSLQQEHGCRQTFNLCVMLVWVWQVLS